MDYLLPDSPEPGEIEPCTPKEPDIIGLDVDSRSYQTVAAENVATEMDGVIFEASYSNPEVKETASSAELNEKSAAASKIDTAHSEMKFNYFNLSDSDSDNEENSSSEFLRYEQLISAAEEKSEVPYGPNKPSKSENMCSNSSSINSYKLPLENTSNSGKSDYSSNNHNLSDKKSDVKPISGISKLNTEKANKFSNIKGLTKNSSKFSNDINDCTNMCVKNSRCIYRKDEEMIKVIRKEKVCRIPRQTISTVEAHSNAVTSLTWCIPKHSYLFLSSSLDGFLKVWDIVKKSAVQTISNSSGLRAAKWSLDGEQIVTGGFGKKAYVYDVQTGKEITHYDVYNPVASLEFHPCIENLFLCGTRNTIFCFDLRDDSMCPVRTFFSKSDEVLDMAFIDEQEFICSSSIVSKDSADRTIMVWDFHSGSLLSNQIYLERYTCPSLKVHPNLPTFGAQTNGDYIALFSSSKPYKMRNQKYFGHKVAGYGIEFDFSPDGKYIASGDADGDLYFYNYSNSNVVCQTTVSEQKSAVNRVKWHPVFYNTLITATWNGFIQIWK